MGFKLNRTKMVILKFEEDFFEKKNKRVTNYNYYLSC